ncbi:MAG TPA: hypothetical protein DIW34_04900 [Oribacterium sp.]|nr:hypothetical protein [Oribacterium sp.]
MMTNTQIRAFARNQLRGHWGTIIGACFMVVLSMTVYTAVQYVIGVFGILAPIFEGFSTGILPLQHSSSLLVQTLMGIVIAALLILGIALYAGLSLGLQKLYLDIARGRQVRVMDVFRGFQDPMHGLHFFGTILIVWLIQIALQLPLFYIGFRFGTDIFDYRVTQTITSVIVYIVTLYLSMAAFASADHPSMTMGQAFKTSFHLMRNKKTKLFGLYLSFFGWMLLTILTCGIAAIWVQPYISESITIFYLSAYSSDYQSKVEDAEYREVEDADYREVQEAEAHANTAWNEAEGSSTPQAQAGQQASPRSFEDIRQEYVKDDVKTNTEEGEKP